MSKDGTVDLKVIESIGATGKTEEQGSDIKGKNVTKKDSAIRKVKAEIVDEKMIAQKKDKELKARELALRSLDKCTDGIRREVDGISKSFCRIGFFLWKIREERLFEERGFRNVYEFAEAVLNFRKSSTGNYINVCERFSERDAKGQPTSNLMDEYRSFSYTQLTEVLSLPEGKEREVRASMSVREIRGLKAKSSKSSSCPPDGSPPAPNGSVASNSFAQSPQKPCPPVCVWNRVVTEDNLEVFLKILKGCILKDVSVYIESDAGEEND